MLLEYKTVYEGGQGEIVEKKSRFIATVQPISSEEQALEFIEAVKKKYWDARHNCFAYVLGERHELARFSDDGEPGGTAGKPMLDVLLGEDIHNVAVVVTRYFGGTLLGTGGLVRAYSGAVKAGLADSLIITRTAGVKLKVGTDYTGLGKIQYILGEKKIAILDSVYTDKVELICMVPSAELEIIKGELIEGTNGRAVLEEGDACYFANIGGEIKILED
ncbi:MAG: YigZ family protein [Eubacteriales bacterium]|nr:YigZ family protein [Eubacteriales bacterium]